MRTTITARHCEIPDPLRERAQVLLERLGKLASRPHDAQAIFGDDHGEAAVELRLHAARGQIRVARAVAPDHRSALDRAAARLRRQLDKQSLPARRRRAARAPARAPR